MNGQRGVAARRGVRGLRAAVVGALAAASVAIGGAAMAQQGARPNIGALVGATGELSTLGAAVKAASLTAALEGDGPITVFAPVNSAFAKLDKGTLESLLRPENRETLVSILTYHVVAGRLTAADIAARSGAETVNGALVGFGTKDGRLTVNGTPIITLDVRASNGVVHLIDGVLLPPQTQETSRDDAMQTGALPDGAAEARALIERAIARGVPLFNEGNVEGCVAVYGITARALVGIGADNVPADVVRGLKRTLDEANAMHDARDRAWALRRGLDAALERLGGPAPQRMPEARSDADASRDMTRVGTLGVRAVSAS
jgi:transforming growth factor-beta-induced protein